MIAILSSLLSGQAVGAATRAVEAPLDSAAYKQMQHVVYGDAGAYLSPELMLLGVILLLLVLGILRRTKNSIGLYHLIAGATLLVALLACIGQEWNIATRVFLDWGALADIRDIREHEGVLGSMLVGDGLSHFFRIFLLVAGALTVWMGWSAREMRDRSLPEFYTLMFGSLVGMMLLAASNHMLMVYLAVEMMSLPSYVMVALRRRQRRATEAAMKYMLFGSVASGAMVYGLSLLYGMTGGLGFQQVSEGIAATRPEHVAALGLALFLFIIGMGYKMAIAPMHFWCPDAYEGAPTPVTCFLSVASKAAGFAVVLRFVSMASGAGAAGGSALPWVLLLSVIGILTMTIGNVTAIRQNNIKRLMAYSSIAHAGYMMIGVAAMAAGRIVGNDALARLGLVSVMVYLVAYLITNYGAFAGVVAIENQDDDNEDITAFRNLARRNILLAVCMFVVLLSLIGIPPTVGFLGKVMLLEAGVEAIPGNPAMLVLLIAAGINTAVSAYYYFRVARHMFLDDAERGSYRPFFLPFATRTLVLVAAVGVLVCFFAFQQVYTRVAGKPGAQLVDTSGGTHDFQHDQGRAVGHVPHAHAARALPPVGEDGTGAARRVQGGGE